MLTVHIELETGNAAYEGLSSAEIATAILWEVRELIGMGKDEGRVRDTNGNTVGKWYLEEV